MIIHTRTLLSLTPPLGLPWPLDGFSHVSETPLPRRRCAGEAGGFSAALGSNIGLLHRNCSMRLALPSDFAMVADAGSVARHMVKQQQQQQ